jgi:hypothetical protein
MKHRPIGKQEHGKKRMVDILLLLDIILVLMVIALAISLLRAVPRDLQKKAVFALRKKTWNSRASNDRGKPAQSPMSCGCSGSHPSTDGPKTQNG